MTQHPELTLTDRRAFQTQRRDTWWLQPLAVFVGLGAFIVYATFRVFEGTHFFHGPYLSPFYSPLLFGTEKVAHSVDHSWFGMMPDWIPGLITPAILILWAPLGFRFTCYYYRGAYYKAFWADPPSCTVSEPRKGYRGEHSFPLIIQNIHRYFLYIAIIFVGILAYDVWKALWFDDGNGGKTFGIGVGTIILTVNVVLLGGYTFGCHSLRHLVGGVIDLLSKAPIRRRAYNCVSCLNERHMLWAWMSLCWVGFSDVYVRFIAPAIGQDWITF
ncbi:succinate dehydrogenase [Candidatus Poribacteria bacterium]|nr:MAG: succinate dehydrogenase [Candidatus Poribacteria bacterium]